MNKTRTIVLGVIIGISVTLGLLMAEYRGGFHLSDYRVTENDTTYDVLLDVFGGSHYQAGRVIDSWTADNDPGLIFANESLSIQDGDIINVEGDTLILKKPNGEVIEEKIVDSEQLNNRNLQLVTKNLIIVAFVVSIAAITYLALSQNKKSLQQKQMILLQSSLVVVLLVLTFEFQLYIYRIFVGL